MAVNKSMLAAWEACRPRVIGLYVAFNAERAAAKTFQAGWESAAEAQMDLVRHLLQLIPEHPGDHACEECRPYSDMLIPGFRCAWHEARGMFPHDCSACGVPLRAHEGERFEDAELLRCHRCVVAGREPIQNEGKV